MLRNAPDFALLGFIPPFPAPSLRCRVCRPQCLCSLRMHAVPLSPAAIGSLSCSGTSLFVVDRAPCALRGVRCAGIVKCDVTGALPCRGASPVELASEGLPGLLSRLDLISSSVTHAAHYCQAAQYCQAALYCEAWF